MTAAAPRWTEEELRAQRDRAADLFIEERKEEGPHAYRSYYQAAEPEVRRLFAATEDLRNMTGGVFEGNRELRWTVRFLAAPPISENDLRTLCGDPLGRRSLDPATAQAVADAVMPVMDLIRFPWLVEQRMPTDIEREYAIRWTAGLMAVQRQGTARRIGASRSQEDQVAEALVGVGLTHRHKKDVGAISMMDQLQRGEFTREVLVAGVKCDVPVRLYDGRFMPLECKVSNSAVNSVKRLAHEAGGKARTWNSHFGAGQCLPAAVLAGVYRLSLLASAQDELGLTIFWQHDLTQLVDFVNRAR